MCPFCPLWYRGGRYQKLQGRLKEEKRAAKLLRAQLADERAAAAGAPLPLAAASQSLVLLLLLLLPLQLPLLLALPLLPCQVACLHEHSPACLPPALQSWRWSG